MGESLSCLLARGIDTVYLTYLQSTKECTYTRTAKDMSVRISHGFRRSKEIGRMSRYAQKRGQVLEGVVVARPETILSPFFAFSVGG